MKLIGLSGKAGHGKDSVFLVLQDILRQKYKVAVDRGAYAHKLRVICCTLFNWDLDRLTNDFAYKEGGLADDPACQLFGMNRREILQKVGTEGMRNGVHKDFWIFVKKLEITNGDYSHLDYLMFPDCRFQNELDFIKELGGINIKVIGVDENGDLVPSTKHSHESETNLDDWTDWDLVFVNRFVSNREQSYNLLKHNVEEQILPLLLGN